VILENPDLVADRRRRDAKLVRGLRNAHVPSGRFEGPERIERWQLASHA
jgi:hypothetical protein